MKKSRYFHLLTPSPIYVFQTKYQYPILNASFIINCQRIRGAFSFLEPPSEVQVNTFHPFSCLCLAICPESFCGTTCRKPIFWKNIYIYILKFQVLKGPFFFSFFFCLKLQEKKFQNWLKWLFWENSCFMKN